ncbi:MAG: DedA family protein [Polyangiaceae bacterium]
MLPLTVGQPADLHIGEDGVPYVDMLHWFIDVVLHLDQYLEGWSQSVGIWLNVILFLVIFCETGLVVAPFLPGDSLLFAIGALAAREGFALKVPVVLPLLIIAAILGDATNYSIGRKIGPAVFSRENSRFLNKKHLLKTQEFYERHGGKTIVIARFAPIIRTFAPFVAGIGKMQYRKFAMYNIAGGIAWVASFILAGYFFGNMPVVKRNFHIVIFGIIFVSLLPTVIEVVRARMSRSAPTSAE